ncbi:MULTISPECIES: IclR family transcriptional regulator [Rhodococcus]|uniref:IclR family transcriptional regulator n=1 Tax=Rhodococcus TaxID=1827 RepID=UPI000496644D|nr:MULTISPECIES: IclR family transcriptional regulator [Rhodococcus]
MRAVKDPTEATASTPSTMRSLERALDVLDLLDNAARPLRLTDVARELGLPKATAQRILGTLEARGRVEKVDGGFGTGIATLFGAHSYMKSNRLILAGRPVLRDLAEETGYTASLYVRVGYTRAVVARVEGRVPQRYQLPIGERLPLHLGAGKVLAAGMTADEIDEMWRTLDDPRYASGQTVDRAEFDRELQKIRSEGYRYATGERLVGMASIAAPILDRDGTYLAAVQINSTAAEVADQIDELSIAVRRAADSVGRHLH